MRRTKLVKCFTFQEKDRPHTTLGPDTRLNPETSRIQLKADPITGEYPTDPNLYVRTRLSTPKAVKQWIGFDVTAIQHLDEDKNPLTSLGFRLSDGTGDFFWNGAAWAPAGTNDWSTEQEVADNISSFPATEQAIQVIVNLATSDPSVTPEVSLIKVLYEASIDFQEDILFRSLVPKLREEIRPIGRHVFRLNAGTSIVNLNQVKLETPYTIRGIDSVFNHTTDPLHKTDLFVSFDEVTGNITLSQTISQGQAVWIEFYYEPVVAVTTSQDFYEVERVPAILLKDIDMVNGNERQISDYVRNKGAGTAWVVPPPIQGDLQVTIEILTDKAVDNRRMMTEVHRFFGRNRFLVSTGLDERYRLWLTDEYGDRTDPSQKELHSSEATFRIVGVRVWNQDAYEESLVTGPPSFDMRRLA